MTFIDGTHYTGAASVSHPNALTVPAGVTSDMNVLVVLGTGLVAGQMIASDAGASLTKLVDDVAAGNMRVTIWTGTGLVAGQTIDFTSSPGAAVSISHRYTDEYTWGTPGTAGTRPGSQATTTSGNLACTSGQRIDIVALERTTADPTVVNSTTSSGGETITQDYFAGTGATQPVVTNYMGHFTASATANRTATITYDDASGNGYIVLIPTTPTAGPDPTLARPGNQALPGTDRLRVAAKCADTTEAKLAVSTASNMASPTLGSGVAPDAQGYVKLECTGLAANTAYYWQIHLDGVPVGDIGLGRTLPVANTPTSFGFAAGSCAQTGSTSSVFDAIRGRTGADGRKALFFAHLGDSNYVYGNGGTVPNVAADIRTMHENVLATAEQRDLRRDIGVSYVWSDVDWGGSNTDGTSAAAATHLAAYRQMYADPVPGSGGIYRSWVAGRVRFIHTDGRSQSSARTATDNSDKTLLGSTQKAWFKAEIDAAVAASQAVVWFHDNAWGGALVNPNTGVDDWRVYTTERAEIAAYIVASSVKMLAYIFGDVHRLSAHSGAGASTDPANLPLFNVAPLDQTSSSHPSPTDGGEYPTSDSVQSNQYGWFDVTDSAGVLTLAFTGYDAGGTARISMSVEWETISGTSGQDLGALTGTATGKRVVNGTSGQSLGALTGTATGTRVVGGTGGQSLGSLTGVATGKRIVVGSSVGNLGALSGVVTSSKRIVKGATNQSLGALATGTAGKRTVLGSAAGNLGALSGSATGAGIVTRSGTSLGALPALSGSASGSRTVIGASAGSLPGLTGTVSASERASFGENLFAMMV